MKIVNRKEFLAMPAGTVYSKYTPFIFDDLSIKGDTWSNDFLCQSLSDAFWWLSSEEYIEGLQRAENAGESLVMDFDCESRDGLFDEQQLFAVWERSDVEGLIARLQLALKAQG